MLVSSCLRLESSARGERRILTIRNEEGEIHSRASGASNQFSFTMKNCDSSSVGPSPVYRETGKDVSTNMSREYDACDVNDKMQLILERHSDKLSRLRYLDNRMNYQMKEIRKITIIIIICDELLIV